MDGQMDGWTGYTNGQLAGNGNSPDTVWGMEKRGTDPDWAGEKMGKVRGAFRICSRANWKVFGGRDPQFTRLCVCTDVHYSHFTLRKF